MLMSVYEKIFKHTNKNLFIDCDYTFVQCMVEENNYRLLNTLTLISSKKFEA